MAFARRPHGFTLVELIVTLAVVAVLAVASVPAFRDALEKQRLRGAADDVVGLLSAARVEALKRERDVNVSALGARDTWCIGAAAAREPALGEPLGAAEACNCADVAQCFVGAQRMTVDAAHHPGVTIDAAPAPYVVDRRLGTTSDLSTRGLTLGSPSGQFALRVSVSALGQARACVPPGKAAIAGFVSC